MAEFDIVILGLSVTSSWGNGHATTYRSLIQGLAARGHRILFLERDQPWYAGNRDEPQPAGAVTTLYASVAELMARFERPVREAALVIVGSFVPDGALVGQWATSIAGGRTAFYDIDTPVTLDKLAAGEHEYISPSLIRGFDLYLSFTGGPVLRLIESRYGAKMARALYCSVDPGLYHPVARPCRWDLGYLGTYSADRQPVLESLLLEPARGWPEGSLRGGGADVSGGHRLAGQCVPRDSFIAARASGVLRRATLHPQYHARGYEAGGSFAQRAPVRGRRLRHPGDQRLVGGVGRAVLDWPRGAGGRGCGFGAAQPARPERRQAPGNGRGGAAARSGRTHAGVPRATIGGLSARSQ